MSLYNIPFAGLKAGIHKFEFEINADFFAFFEDEELKAGEIKVQVELNKKPNLLELDIAMQGKVSVMCDRCLDYFDMVLDTTSQLFIKFGEALEELDDDVIQIPKNDDKINIAKYLYEYIRLSLPITKTHEEYALNGATCNEDMIERLNQHLINENQPSSEVSEDDDIIDPRWEILKQIKNN